MMHKGVLDEHSKKVFLGRANWLVCHQPLARPFISVLYPGRELKCDCQFVRYHISLARQQYIDIFEYMDWKLIAGKTLDIYFIFKSVLIQIITLWIIFCYLLTVKFYALNFNSIPFLGISSPSCLLTVA